VAVVRVHHDLGKIGEYSHLKNCQMLYFETVKNSLSGLNETAETDSTGSMRPRKHPVYKHFFIKDPDPNIFFILDPT
jgi:hypothetical protein